MYNNCTNIYTTNKHLSYHGGVKHVNAILTG